MQYYVTMPRKEVSPAFLAEIMYTATTEIYAWCEIVRDVRTEDPTLNTLSILVENDDGNGKDPHTVNLDTIHRGITLAIGSYSPKLHKAFSTLGIPSFGQKIEWLISSIEEGDTSMVDGDVADMIVQYGIFDEELYS